MWRINVAEHGERSTRPRASVFFRKKHPKKWGKKGGPPKRVFILVFSGWSGRGKKHPKSGERRGGPQNYLIAI